MGKKPSITLNRKPKKKDQEIGFDLAKTVENEDLRQAELEKEINTEYEKILAGKSVGMTKEEFENKLSSIAFKKFGPKINKKEKQKQEDNTSNLITPDEYIEPDISQMVQISPDDNISKSKNNNQTMSLANITSNSNNMNNAINNIPAIANNNNIVTSTIENEKPFNYESPTMNPNVYKLLPDSKYSLEYEKRLNQRYNNANNLLMQSVSQADYLFLKVESELEKYKKYPEFGGRTRAMSMATLLNTQANILGTKVSTIKEMNNIQKNIIDSAQKRDQLQVQAKIKAYSNDTSQQEMNNDKAISDAYYSLINASRYGLPAVNNPLAQSSINTGINLAGNIIPSSNLSAPIVTSTENDGFLPPMNNPTPVASGFFDPNNLNPTQKRMVIEHDNNIKIVVFYDQSTGGKKFEALNISTGQIVPGVQLPAAFLLENMKIDFNNKLAYNSSANLSYPLVIVGRRAIDEL